MSITELQLSQQPLEIQTLIARFQEVESNLITKTPGLPTALAEIHKMLQQHEEMIHLFDDDDMKKLHQAHELFKQYAVVQNATKQSKSKKIPDSKLLNL